MNEVVKEKVREKEEEPKGLTYEEVKSQSEITATDIARSLKESVKRGLMVYPKLVRILRYALRKAILEMTTFRSWDILTPSLDDLGLEILYKELEKIEEKETKEEVQKIKEDRERNKSEL